MEEGSAMKMDNQQLVCSSGECSSTLVGFGQEFLKNEQVKSLEYLLTWLPLIFTRSLHKRFCDATDIIMNATKELKRLSHNGFQECLQMFPTPLYSLAEVYSCRR
jgi:hypothetical protein